MIRNWEDGPIEQTSKGVALRCVACKALLINAQSYRAHVSSKRHGKAVKAWPDDLGPPVVFATDAARGEETGETHAERLERLRRQAALDAEDADGGAPQGSGKKKKKVKGDGGKPERKRPGKRQRAALKEERTKATAGDGAAAGKATSAKGGVRKRPGKKQLAALKAAAATSAAGNGSGAAAVKAKSTPKAAKEAKAAAAAGTPGSGKKAPKGAKPAKRAASLA